MLNDDSSLKIMHVVIIIWAATAKRTKAARRVTGPEVLGNALNKYAGQPCNLRQNRLKQEFICNKQPGLRDKPTLESNYSL